MLMLTSGGRSSGRNDSRGGLMLLGLGVFVLGLVGAFFGRLIMAAVSRQREYLADASAVQFTRNSEGIGGALKKIGGLAEGSRIANPQAAEVGHMFFANALGGGGLAGLLATHPPLVGRIRRLDPQFDGQFPEVRSVGIDRAELEGPWGRVPPVAGMPSLPGVPQVPLPVLGLADETASRIGHVDPEEISYAQALHDGMPDVLRVAAQEPFSARALVYTLLLDPRPDLRDLQLTRLKAGVDGLIERLQRRVELGEGAVPAIKRRVVVALRGLHPCEPAGHRPRSGGAPRDLRYARLPATATRRGGSGRTMNDRMSAFGGKADTDHDRIRLDATSTACGRCRRSNKVKVMTRVLLVGYDPEAVDFSNPA
jgi:hypothetical protein